MENDTDPNDPPEPQVPSPDGSRTWVAKMLIAALVLPIRAYQILISPLIGPHCRFTPTCSGYAIEAIRKYGPVKGSWRAARRIGRCHPWNPGGYDPP